MKQRVYIFPTFACTLHCPRCYQRTLKCSSRYMMAWDIYKDIINEFVSQGIQISECVFSGGEPALWPDLCRAIYRAKQVADRVRVVTNAYKQDIRVYGNADIIQVSDYGAINRMDYYRLKKLSRRVRLQSAVHWDWDRNEKSVLPGSCGCTGLSFVGSQVWPCAMAAVAQEANGRSIYETDMTSVVDPRVFYQDFCRSCLVNRKNRKVPKPVVQVSLWESRSWMIG